MLILGAGPTGLGALQHLRSAGADNAVLLEASTDAGGLSRTVLDPAGFRWDFGGHVVFSHYPSFDDVFEDVLAGEYTLNDRESYIRSFDRWVPYPFQNNLWRLPEPHAERCVAELEHAQRERDPLACADFGSFIDAAFGDGIAELFMRPYNEKVWAHPPESMQREWIGERVAMIDAARARRNLKSRTDDAGWGPNNRFKYPLDGTGELYRRLAERHAPAIRFGRRVTGIDTDRRTAVTGSGEKFAYEHLLSTLPLDVLVREIITDAPDEVRRAAEDLVYASGHFIGVGLDGACPRSWSWMYFPEPETPFYRATFLSNYSPRMVPRPGEQHSILCEISESEHRPVDAETLAERTLDALIRDGLIESRERVASLWQARIERSYPVPSLGRDAALETILPWLESVGIASRGRFGLWKYEVANTDHCFMQGVEWAERLLTGAPETTIGVRYEVRPDGRGRAISERPAVAGSGEKRRTP